MSTLLASVVYFRHGQRAPFRADGDAAAYGPSIWSTRPFPSLADWGMSEAAFLEHRLTPHGHALLQHTGEYMRQTSEFASSVCNVPTVFLADDSTRDFESAAEFGRGYLAPAGCATPPLLVGNISSPGLAAIANDHQLPPACPQADEATVQQYFGGDMQALTDLYRLEIDRIGAVLGCCSAVVCSRYGLHRNCTLAEVPYKFTGTYWNGLYSGAMQALMRMVTCQCA